MDFYKELSPSNILLKLIEDIPQLKSCEQDIYDAYNLISECYKNGNKVMICGNGGSASDSEHIVGELMKGFLLKRPVSNNHREILKSNFPQDGDYLADNLQGSLPAISLVSQTSISTAFINDVAPDMVYAQQVYGYAKDGDVLIGITTSGNSKNVVNAIKVAKTFGVKCIGMTGSDGGILISICDITIKAPAKETYKVQEYHLMIYHALCAMIELNFFKV
jgi:D-sedoheptulose 7-phosphate isomerase